MGSVWSLYSLESPSQDQVFLNDRARFKKGSKSSEKCVNFIALKLASRQRMCELDSNTPE